MALHDLVAALTPASRKVYESLAAYAEATSDYRPGDASWWTVYLDNARPDDMPPRTFQAHLAVLSHAGLYKVEDSYAFGYVLTDKPLTPSP